MAYSRPLYYIYALKFRTYAVHKTFHKIKIPFARLKVALLTTDFTWHLSRHLDILKIIADFAYTKLKGSSDSIR